jgi:hypothetical protein
VSSLIYKFKISPKSLKIMARQLGASVTKKHEGIIKETVLIKKLPHMTRTHLGWGRALQRSRKKTSTRPSHAQHHAPPASDDRSQISQIRRCCLRKGSGPQSARQVIPLSPLVFHRLFSGRFVLVLACNAEPHRIWGGVRRSDVGLKPEGVALSCLPAVRICGRLVVCLGPWG